MALVSMPPPSFERIERRVHATAGAEMLSDVALNNPDLGDRDMLATLWRAVHAEAELFSFRQFVDNQFNLDWPYLVYEPLAEGVQAFRSGFHIPVAPADADLAARLFAGDGPIVLVSIHSGMPLAVARIADLFGLRTTFITRTGNPGWSLGLYGFERPVTYIPRRPESLFIARGHAREGQVVMGLVDYTLADPITGDTTAYLSPTMFKFAARIGARLVFAYPTIGEDAVLRVELAEAEHPDAPVEHQIDAFRTFLVRFRPQCASWETGDWARDTGRSTNAVRGDAQKRRSSASPTAIQRP